MNSESGRRLSTEEIKNRVKANAAMAAATQTTVILTDQNWGALNNSVTLLADLAIRNTDAIRQLITERQMKEYLEEQIQNLQSDLNVTESNVDVMLSEMQETLNSQSDRLKTQTERSISEISSQAGRERELFLGVFRNEGRHEKMAKKNHVDRAHTVGASLRSGTAALNTLSGLRQVFGDSDRPYDPDADDDDIDKELRRQERAVKNGINLVM